MVATQYMPANLKKRCRLVADTLMAIIPIMILLLFTYVFGGSLAGSIQTGGAAKVNYVNYQLPGILLMAIEIYGARYSTLAVIA